MEKKKPPTDEELKKLKQVNQPKVSKEAKQSEKEGILFETAALTQKKLRERNKEKDKEIFELTDGRRMSIFSKKQFDKMLLKSPVFRDVTFVPEYYDELYRLTGLKKSETNPHQKPDIFSVYTIKYIYRRFNIKNLMQELWNRNPFITGQSFREFKHYNFFDEANYLRLLGFINDMVTFAKKCNTMYEFDVEYCKHYGLTTDADMFYGN
jgi:hypothetical protein